MPHDQDLLRTMQAKAWNERRLWRHPNVTAIATARRRTNGLRTEEWAVQVRVSQKLAPSRLPAGGMLPREVFGPDGKARRVDVVQSGPFVGCADRPAVRPIYGGLDIGRAVWTDYSTLGGMVCDREDDETVLLSCNHAIANLDREPKWLDIVQPARHYGGIVGVETVGFLKRYSPIAFGGSDPPASPVDAAIGTVEVEWAQKIADISTGIFAIDEVTEDDPVQKYGSTTGLTSGLVKTIPDATVLVELPFHDDDASALVSKLVRIENAFCVESDETFAQAGDSGALVFSQTPGVFADSYPCVGLLFAKDQYDDRVGFCNNITAVFNTLNLSTVFACLLTKLIQILIFRLIPEWIPAPPPDLLFYLRIKEVQFRDFRDRIVRNSVFGTEVNELLTRNAGLIASVLAHDSEAFGLALRALAPWVRLSTDLDILEAPIDAESVAGFCRLADRLAHCEPSLRPALTSLKAALKAAQGTSLGDALAAATPPIGP